MKRLFFLLNLILILIGYSVYVNQWVSPNVTSIFEYSALLFPVIVILDIIFIIFWLIYRWKIALIIMLLSIGLVKPLNRIYHIYGGEKVMESNLKFMTYNLKLLSLNSKEKIEKLVKEEHPDILVLQELPLKQKNYLKDDFKYMENYGSIGILSQYPIIESNQLKIGDEKIRACYADIKFNADTIRVINLHLSSVRINKKEIAEVHDKKTLESNLKKVVKNLFSAFKAHQGQVIKIRKVIDSSPYPIIVGGDFNSVPSSYEYYKVGKGLKDTFIYGGSGLGSTYYDLKIPLKIDHVFVSPEFDVNSTEIKKVKYSDHYPVFVNFNYTFKNK